WPCLVVCLTWTASFGASGPGFPAGFGQGALVLFLLFDGGFPGGEELFLMEAQVLQLIALLAQQLGVVVDLGGVDLVVQLHLPSAAPLHLLLAGLDPGPQLGAAAALFLAVAGFGGLALF